MNFSIDKNKIEKAANSCPTARKVLETLFPEAFEEVRFLTSRGSYNESVIAIDENKRNWAIASEHGHTSCTRFQLSNVYDWEIITENNYNYLKAKLKNG